MFTASIQHSPRLETLGLRPDRLALGTAALGGVWGPVNRVDSVDTILMALAGRISVLDTAPAYADAELIVAEALRQWPGPTPLISTKIGRLRSDAADIGVYDYSPEAMRRSIGNSLALFKVTQLDLVFLHDPEEVPTANRPAVVDSLHGFVADGLVRHIGFGGNPDADWLRYIQTGVFDVAMGFNRVNACNLDAFAMELPVYRQQNLAYCAGSPLYMGLLGRRFAEYVQHPPGWMATRDVALAKHVNNLANEWGLSLPTLAHRYLFSIADIDRVILGAGNQTDLQRALTDYQAGALPDDLFDQLTTLILNTHA